MARQGYAWSSGHFPFQVEMIVNTSTPAGFADKAAAALHDKADSLPGGERVARAAHVAAHGLETAADYVRERKLRGMLADIQGIAKRHPGPVLLIAVVAGFLLAKAMSRDSSSRDYQGAERHA